MSKNIVIQEGGVGKQLTADKLKTNLVGGGTCLWVPEDETILGTKIITENGTYKASDDGYYGYSEVTVSGIGTATGTDGDGDEAVAHTDPVTEELVTDKVPSSIVVVTPPTNRYGIYTDGQTIETDGMVVKAYLASGGEYGTVPLSEITMQPTTATYDESTDNPHYTGDGIDALLVQTATQNYINDPVHPGQKIEDGWVYATGLGTDSQGRRTTAYTPQSHGPGGFLLTIYNDYVYGIRIYGPDASGLYSASDDAQWGGWHYWGVSFGYIDKTEFRKGVAVNELHWEELPVSTVDPTTVDPESLTPQQSGSHQTITVSWPRPLDGKVLETTFEILVAPPYSDGSEE